MFLLKKVEQSARRRDDHIHAPMEMLDLVLHVGPAIDRNSAGVNKTAVRADGIFNLLSQFSRRRENESPDVMLFFLRLRPLDEAVEDGEDEGRRFSRPRFRCGDDVLALQRDGDGA